MIEKKDLSIIIVSFNTKQLTDACLESVFSALSKSTISGEVIVVDNVSTDGSVEMIRKKYPKVTLIVNKENVGFGRGNNQGMRLARGKHILLLNSDTILTGQALSKLYEFSVRHPKAFVGPKLLNLDRSDQTSCGPFFTLPVIFAVLFLKGDQLKVTRWSPIKTKKVDWVSGACIMAPKALFDDDLMFDEKIFMYMEEIDLLYRARAKGYSTYFYPGSQIVHLGSGSSTNRKKGPILNIFKGFLFFYRKHYSSLAVSILRVLLRLKAIGAMSFGFLTGNKEMYEIYSEAYQLV